MAYTYNNILGTFILDDNLKITKGKSGKLLPKEKSPGVIANFSDKKYFKDFYQKNLEKTKEDLKHSVNENQLIIQTIANVQELDRTSNLLTKRLREWYSLFSPELSENNSNHERFVELVIKKTKEKDSFGADLDKVHVDEMISLAKEITTLQKLREGHERYLEKIMRKYCPNLLELAGVTIGAKLIELGKSLKRLAMLPASTIQLLGAEKALFRHIKTGSKSPKYGVIIHHQIVQDAKNKGKAARMLADKLSLCCRLDFFKGEFKAKEYREILEGKLK